MLFDPLSLALGELPLLPHRLERWPDPARGYACALVHALPGERTVKTLPPANAAQVQTPPRKVGWRYRCSSVIYSIAYQLRVSEGRLCVDKTTTSTSSGVQLLMLLLTGIRVKVKKRSILILDASFSAPLL